MEKKILIYSHPRSGSNYFAQLINLNFCFKDDYNEIYGGHRFPGEKLKENPDVIFLYIKRNFSDMINSLFKMKEAFGLDVDSIQELKMSRYKDVYNGRLFSLVKIKDENSSTVESRVSQHFRNIEMTPKEYHRYHIQQWESHSEEPNFYSVSYENLLTDYEKELEKIADKFLLKKPPKWVNVEKRVGYIPYTNPIIRFVIQKVNRFFISPILKIVRH